MKKFAFIILLLALMPIIQPLWALEEARFPRPEFTGDYQTPEPTRPLEPSLRNPYLALFLMVLLLAMTGYGLYIKRSRTWLTAIGLISLIWFGFVFKGCVCPIGSIQNVFTAMLDRSIHVSAHVVGVFFIPLLVALFWGRLFCGAVCPFGVLQDLVNFRATRVPPILDGILKLLPFIFLGLALYLAACDFGFMICRFDPFIGLFRLSAPFSILILSGVTLLLAVFVARPYCRYVCPYSVLLSAAALLSPRRVQVYPDRCTNCRLCLPSCPVKAIVPEVNINSPKAFAEPREKAINRLQWLVALSPFLLAIGFYSGTQLSSLLQPVHGKAVLLKAVQAREIEDDKVIAFYANDGDVKALEKQVDQMHNKIRTGGGIFGIYASLVFIGAVFAATRRRTNDFHLVEPWNCVACGHCYSWCPRAQEQKT